MFAPIIIAALIASAVCQQCGISHFPSTTLTNGIETATKGEFPWVVSIRINSPNTLFHNYNCSGAIIDETTIVTSGICGEFFNPEELQVRAGVIDLRENEETKQEAEVLKIIHHDKYNHFKELYDFAILKLKTPLKFNEYVQPICFPEPFEEHSGSCITAGWFRNDGSAYASAELQKLSAPLISDDACRGAARPGSSLSQIPDHVFCTDYSQVNADVTQDQQGSPVMCQNQRGQYALTGVYIWRYYGPGYAFKVNTQISHFVDWIKNRM